MGYCANQIDGGLTVDNAQAEIAMGSVVYNYAEGNTRYITQNLEHDKHGSLRRDAVKDLDSGELFKLFEETASDAGFSAEQYDDGIHLCWEGDKWMSCTTDFLDYVAPFASEGSSLVMNGEDGCVWVESFEDGKRESDGTEVKPCAKMNQARDTIVTAQEKLAMAKLHARSLAKLTELGTVEGELALSIAAEVSRAIELIDQVEANLKK